MSNRKSKGRSRHATVTLKADGMDFGVANKFLFDAREVVLKKDEDSLFRIKYDGYEFDGLPFLIMSADWWKAYHQDDLSQEALKFSQHVSYLDLDDLYVSKESELVQKTLIASPFANGMSLVASFLAHKDKRAFAKLVMREAGVCLQEVLINSKCNHLVYTCEGIHNSQAFSYYMLLAWVVTLHPPLGIYLKRQIRASGYSEMIDSFAPEGSYLRRYIRGEISAKEFHTAYSMPRFLDGTSLRDRELLAMLSEGKYDGTDITPAWKEILETCKGMTDGNLVMRFGMQMGRYYARSEARWEADTEIVALRNKVDYYQSQLDQQRSKYNSIIARKDARIEKLGSNQSKLDKLENENKKLRDSIVKESRVDTLTEELEETQAELNRMIEKYSVLKTELRSLRKLARPVTQSVEEEVVTITEEPEEQISVNDMLLRLANLRVLVVGGDTLGIPEYLSKRGMKAFQFSRSLKVGFKCDIIMIVTHQVAHKEVGAAVAWARGNDYELVYFNGTSKDKCIETLYSSIT